MVYLGKGEAVPMSRCILIFRALQSLFAILVIATTAYPLSIHSGGPLKSPLIAAIIIAVLTVVPILILTTALHTARRKIFDSRIAILLDGFAVLYWLASFAALASYQDIFSEYGRESRFVIFEFNECRECRTAWKSGVAATLFCAIEFILFLFTSLILIYYYHYERVGVPAPGISHRRKHLETGAATTGFRVNGVSGPGTGVTGGTTAREHELHSVQPHVSMHSAPGHHSHDIPAPPTSGGYGARPGTAASATTDHKESGSGTAVPQVSGAYESEPAAPSRQVTYPTSPTVSERPGGDGRYQAGSNTGYGADTATL